MKVCLKCQISLEESNFSIRRRLGGKYLHLWPYCKRCRAIDEKIRRVAKRDEIRIKDAIRVRVIRPAKNRRALPFGITHKDVELYRNKRLNPKPYQSTGHQVFVANMRWRIKCAIIHNYRGSSLQFLGCQPDQARKHLESRFTPDMNWGNYGSYWHIDHHIPISHFDLSDDFQCKCAFNWMNLRPLTVYDNLKKHAKVPSDAEELLNSIKSQIMAPRLWKA